MPATIAAPAPTSAPQAPKPTSPTPTPKSPNAPVAPPESPSSDEGALGDTFAELDAIDNGSTAKDAITKTSQNRQERTPAAPAPDAKKDTKDSSTELEKDAGSASPATESAAKPVKAADLRAAYDGAKQKIKEYESKIPALEAKLKEYESKPPEDNKPLLEKLAALEKKTAEYEEELKFTNYVKHPEFTEKYQKPYNEAWAKAVREIEQLAVTQEDGSTRQATPGDVLALANSPLATLDERAEAMFGRSAARVIRHVERIRDLAEAQEKAIADAKTVGSEREKNLKVQQDQRNARVASILQKTNADLASKYPKWFGKEPTDPEGNAVFDKGMDYVDKVFSGDPSIPEETRISRMAVIRNKAANHDRLALHLKNANSQIAELKASLEAYEKSEPPTGKAGEASTAKTGNWVDDANAEIEALDKR